MIIVPELAGGGWTVGGITVERAEVGVNGIDDGVTS
jgi:hypothetical protein